jgi:2,3-diketo-5-methylthio-1-phosphopentane phosphatase
MVLAQGFQVFSDFDGTISRTDSLKLLLDHFGGQVWTSIKARMDSGEVTEREAVAEVFREFPISVNEATDWVLQNVSIDPAFSTFYRWLQEKNAPLTILSGGFVQFIRPLLAREGLPNVRVIANSAIHAGAGWEIRPAGLEAECLAFHHCKCSSMSLSSQSSMRLTVYVGDGNTDHCPAARADLVFAKKSLADFRRQQGVSFTPFEDFRDVRMHLESLLFKKVA